MIQSDLRICGIWFLVSSLDATHDGFHVFQALNTFSFFSFRELFYGMLFNSTTCSSFWCWRLRLACFLKNFFYRKQLLSILRDFAEWSGQCYTINSYMQTYECAVLYHMKCALRVIALFETWVVKNASIWWTKYFHDSRCFEIFMKNLLSMSCFSLPSWIRMLVG